jgi:hypothetical protein
MAPTKRAVPEEQASLPAIPKARKRKAPQEPRARHSPMDEVYAESSEALLKQVVMEDAAPVSILELDPKLLIIFNANVGPQTHQLVTK